MRKKILIHEVAIREIINLIQSRGLKQGDKLPPERELVKQLNISRACIREALQVLSSNYIVQIKPGSGIYVNVVDESVIGRYITRESSEKETLGIIKSIVEMRLLLETHGFQQVARTITPEQLGTIYSHEANEYSNFLKEDQNRTGAAVASMDLEQLILTCQPNTILTSTHNRMNITWKACLSRINYIPLPTDIRHRDHIAIIMAIEQNDPKKISKAVSAHLHGTYQALERLIAE